MSLKPTHLKSMPLASASIKSILEQRVSAAMQAVGIPDDCPPVVARSKQIKFGDFQANGMMGAAKKISAAAQQKTNPRELAEKVIAVLDLGGIADKCEIAGPGFINIFLSNTFLDHQLNSEELLSPNAPSNVQRVVVDYSGPNLAKEMHVGHLRSTIIGDAIVRTLEYQGHTVIRQNHMGDWGTQFGMLIAELEAVEDTNEIALSDLEKFYQQSKKHFDEDEAFAQKARDYVVRLQSGDQHCSALWQKFIDISISHSMDIYQHLGVSLGTEHAMPESAYNNQLAGIVAKLESLGLAIEDNGAKVVFLEELADKEGKPSPVIVQKSGGGFLYSTSDLAAVDYRCQTLKADRILYFIDARQSLHMKQVFTIAKKTELAPKNVSLEHHAFGTMMAKDGKPFKTRTGGTVKLADLMQEAVERAAGLLAERDSALDSAAQAEVARKVGIGAVKYADLSKTRTNDYLFDWDGMLSFEGNTAPYLQYAYTRIRSVFRKAELSPDDIDVSNIHITRAEERVLALQLLQFQEVVQQVAAEAYPHVMCNYLYDIASAYMSFYEACPILKDGVSTEARASRLALSLITSQVLAMGLDLLGIEVMEHM